MARAGVPAKVPLAPRVTPEGRGPVSLNVMPELPVAVTLKVPAVFSAKVVLAAEVNTGDPVTATVLDFADAVPTPLALIACAVNE